MNAATRGDCLWVVSKDKELHQRAEHELAALGCRVRMVDPALLDTPRFWPTCPRHPGAILLDVVEDLDAARSVLRRMKRARIPSPVIVITANPSHEFGTKIVSLGVSYLLPRDFAPGELADVFNSLVKPHAHHAPS